MIIIENRILDPEQLLHLHTVQMLASNSRCHLRDFNLENYVADIIKKMSDEAYNAYIDALKKTYLNDKDIFESNINRVMSKMYNPKNFFITCV
jgi:hypothetical protein